jgi:hypothetical protein
LGFTFRLTFVGVVVADGLALPGPTKVADAAGANA